MRGYEHIAPSCPEVMVVLYHAKEVSQLFYSFGRLNREYSLHLITLRFDSIFNKYVPQVFYFKCAECGLSALTFKPASRSRLRTFSSLFLDGLRGCSLRCRGGHLCKRVHTLRIPLAPSWKKSGEPAIPISNLEYLPQGKLIVQIFECI